MASGGVLGSYGRPRKMKLADLREAAKSGWQYSAHYRLRDCVRRRHLIEAVAFLRFSINQCASSSLTLPDLTIYRDAR
ncbi:unnamed protein product [Urochloa humidicola]